jgi:hypothetical protein
MMGAQYRRTRVPVRYTLSPRFTKAPGFSLGSAKPSEEVPLGTDERMAPPWPPRRAREWGLLWLARGLSPFARRGLLAPACKAAIACTRRYGVSRLGTRVSRYECEMRRNSNQ